MDTGFRHLGGRDCFDPESDVGHLHITNSQDARFVALRAMAPDGTRPSSPALS